MAYVVYIGPHDAVEVRAPGGTEAVEIIRDGDPYECDDDTATNLVAGGDWRYQDGKAETPADPVDAVDGKANDEDNA